MKTCYECRCGEQLPSKTSQHQCHWLLSAVNATELDADGSLVIDNDDTELCDLVEQLWKQYSPGSEA